MERNCKYVLDLMFIKSISQTIEKTLRFDLTPQNSWFFIDNKISYNQKEIKENRMKLSANHFNSKHMAHAKNLLCIYGWKYIY